MSDHVAIKVDELPAELQPESWKRTGLGDFRPRRWLDPVRVQRVTLRIKGLSPLILYKWSVKSYPKITGK